MPNKLVALLKGIALGSAALSAGLPAMATRFNPALKPLQTTFPRRTAFVQTSLSLQSGVSLQASALRTSGWNVLMAAATNPPADNSPSPSNGPGAPNSPGGTGNTPPAPDSPGGTGNKPGNPGDGDPDNSFPGFGSSLPNPDDPGTPDAPPTSPTSPDEGGNPDTGENTGRDINRNPDTTETGVNPSETGRETGVRLNPDGRTFTRMSAVRRFGDNYFDQARARLRASKKGLNGPTSALGTLVGPEFTAPAPDHYNLGPGDTLTLRYWNDVTPVRENEVTVDSRGAVNLPMSGKLIVVRGQTLQTAEALFRRELSRVLRTPQVTVTMKRLRSISVTLIGNSFAPGSYQMPSSTTLFNALYLTGGPDTNGSLRTIQLKRPGSPTRSFDFYRFLINGDSSQDVPLQSGDLIFIPPARIQVSVKGEALRPALYELISGETLGKLIRFAGGVRPSAVAQRVSVQSVRPGIARRLVDANLLTSGDNDLPLYDGDSVTIFPIRPQLENMITLEGAVDQPSRYQLTDNMTVADLIERARGTLSNAYMKRADLFRKQADGSDQLIVINLEAALKNDPKENVALHSNDRLVIYGVNDVQWMGDHRLTLTGAARRPGAYIRAEGMHVSDLLVQAGGLKPDAESRMAFLQRTNPDGSPGPLLKINLLQAAAGDPEHNLVLQDRDELRIFTLEEASYRPEQKVEIKGAVQKPDTYFRSSNMTVVDLTQMAGGLLPNAYASQVYLQRKSDDGAVGPLILLDLRKALDGDQAQNALVKDGDSLIINTNAQAQFTPRQIIRILGQVQRPGSYPRASNMTLLDLIRLAGGPLPNASDSVEITKAIAPRDEKSLNVSLARTLAGDPASNPRLTDEAVVTIHARGDVRTQVETVTLNGAVRQPGTYTIVEGERLSSVIQRAGGLALQAFPRGAQFFRDSQFLTTSAQRDILPGVAQILSVVSEQQYKRALGRAELERIKLTAGQPQGAAANPALITALPGINPATGTSAQAAVSPAASTPRAQVDTVSPARPLLEEDWIPGGNLGVDVAMALKQPQGRNDLIMLDGDILNIPNQPTTVSVVGAVLQPSSVLYSPGQSISDYIARSGGFLQDAAVDQIVLIRSNGQLLLPKAKASNLTVDVGDVILVPTRVMAERLKDQGASLDRIAGRVSSTAVMLALLRTLFR